MTNNLNLENQITLTTGMFDLLKVQIAKRRLDQQNELRISSELRNAKQVLRRDLPAGIVDVYKTVTVIDLETNEQNVYNFVPQNVARRKHGTVSILSGLGIALLGHKEGTKLKWETPEGEKSYHIKAISDFVR